ncbi:Spo0E family sporulation regulatory protein-aspartic acid phosphatase [Aneurinibacillus sp. REN35]|uniref:Spo0E family sporulation regulatory protein-aspartic acid phosphatase n=1 Tax=Aneurinibacillus sp. REN35 TaxID=3237286 RepID=UPI003528E15D
MKFDHTLSCRIEELKTLLALTAAQHNFNFQHPSVLYISQKLDQLIIKAMRPQEELVPAL